MRLVMGAMACGPSQLTVAAVGLWSGLLSEPIGLALIAGALVVEVLAPLRGRVAKELALGPIDDSQ